MEESTTEELKRIRSELFNIRLQKRLVKNSEELTKLNMLYNELTNSYKHLTYEAKEKEGRKKWRVLKKMKI